MDLVLEPYIESGKRPITTATILRIGDGDLIRDLTEEQKRFAFIIAELISMAGLSNRRFFDGLGMTYCSRRNFSLIIQRFQEPGSGTAIITRRRDGTTQTQISKDAHYIRRPAYLFVPFKIEFDLGLLHALLGAQTLSDEQWSPILEAITLFNLANTDSDEIPEFIELVLVSGAFERVLECASSEQALSESVTSLLPSGKAMPLSELKRLGPDDIKSRFRHSTSIRDVWIRDFFRLRGNLAHGRTTTAKYPSLWSLKDHLLFASFAFPLLLKCKLAKLAVYSLTERDQVHIDTFESLLCEDHCVPLEDEENPIRPLWNRILEEAMLKRYFDAIDKGRKTSIRPDIL